MNTRTSSAKRGYNSRWQKARLTFLARNPLCKYCDKAGRVEAATVVDHIIPHKGDSKLFWDVENWQQLCAPCHNSIKQSEENKGYATGFDEEGFPIDEKHPFNLCRQ
jgi:5-methylcytosine-specific restriction protein A